MKKLLDQLIFKIPILNANLLVKSLREENAKLMVELDELRAEHIQLQNELANVRNREGY